MKGTAGMLEDGIRIQKGIRNVGDAMCEKLEAIQGEQVGHALRNDVLDKEMDGDWVAT